VDADYLKKLVGDNTKEDADNLIMFNWGEQYGWHASRFVGYGKPSKTAAKTKVREGVWGEGAVGERSRADYQPGGGRSCRGTGGGSAPC